MRRGGRLDRWRRGARGTWPWLLALALLLICGAQHSAYEHALTHIEARQAHGDAHDADGACERCLVHATVEAAATPALPVLRLLTDLSESRVAVLAPPAAAHTRLEDRNRGPPLLR